MMAIMCKNGNTMINENVKLWMAPLHGVTLCRFRNLFLRHFGGVDELIAPFLPVTDSHALNFRQWKDILPENNASFRVLPQLMGNQPEQFVNTLRLLADLGYESANWNIGCPMPQIVRKTRGCGLMPNPDVVERVVDAVCSHTSFRFSLKMRLGLKSPQESIQLLQRLEGYPLEFIVVHPRLGVQQYEGVPDWDAFDTLVSATSHELVYSGDIWSVGDFQRLQLRYPTIRQWMLGRGLLRNPFLAEQIKLKSPLTENAIGRFEKFYDDLLLAWRASGVVEKGILNGLKELWHYFSVFFCLSDEELKILLRMNNLDDFEVFSRKCITKNLV